MTYNEIRNLFLNYFKDKGHTIAPSASLIPNDPTLLFTVAGMVPWKGMLQGTEDLKYGPRVADVQKCIRAGGKHNDLEDVGFDGSHHTFFEMMGNWSFGDYFKQGAIEMSWELLTQVLKLDINRLVITTHISDDESTKIWKKLTGKDAIRLDKDNWWAAGDTGPCGPSTEIFWDFGDDLPGGLPGAPDEAGRYVEIWNNVFMEYDCDANGKLTDLPNKNVDTGAGLERWAAVLQGKRDNYETDLFVNLIKAVSDITGAKKTAENTPSFKIIADHLRSVGFAIADGVQPGNSDRGYVVRRILRRAMRHGQILGHKGELLSKLYPALIEQMGEAYPELIREKDRVIEIIKKEENSFADMLANGMKLLDKEIPKLTGNILPGDVAFKLFDTYGFPLDLTEMILRDKHIDVDTDGFTKCMKEQKERSRANTKGTKTLWESRTDLEATDDSRKYNPDTTESKVIAILKDGEFTDSANADDEVEIALDKTTFYGTQGGQVGDSGEFKGIMKITEASRAGNIVIHKGKLTSVLHVWDSVIPVINATVREQTARAHTAAHLLHAALQKILGDGAVQKGSKVSPDSVRFDFGFDRPLTDEEKKAIEEQVNIWIDAKLDVKTIETNLDTAKSMGAKALFGDKYGDKVRVISAGDISCELCGGTHATNTGDLIHAKINKVKSVASGIRRITMSVGDLAK